ncbi:MAG: hydroxymethylbilane synthase [Gammaproteobacteria bacterium]
MMKTIRIATRQSALALWQAHWIGDLLQAKYPDLHITWVLLTTQGDRDLDVSLSKIGGKALFLKELESALLNDQADIAVHSLKDCPVNETPELTLAAFLPRATPWDAFLSTVADSVQELPMGAIVGTSSLRRQTQLKAMRPDLTIRMLRGNVDTRVKKMLSGEYDAIILAACGLERLNLGCHIRGLLPPAEMLPAIGQGVVVVQCAENSPFLGHVQSLHDPRTHAQAVAERSLGAQLGSSCQVPIGGHARWEGDKLVLTGLVGSLDGSCILRAESTRDMHEAEALGIEVAHMLVENGALEIIQEALSG